LLRLPALQLVTAVGADPCRDCPELVRDLVEVVVGEQTEDLLDLLVIEQADEEPQPLLVGELSRVERREQRIR
jgi:hypothetical protein